jgi:hypothetical protein
VKGPYSKCTALYGDGSDIFWAAVQKHLEQLAAIQQGPAFFQAIQRTGKRITIKMAGTSGNSTSFANDGAPLLVQAILNDDNERFRNELKVATGQAASKGIPLDHVATQLSEGLTPVTYQAAANVVRPQSKVPTPGGAAPATAAAAHAHAAMRSMGMLQELMDGRLTLVQMPQDWRTDIPRVLRPFLTPGRGTDSTISFDPGDWKPCAIDPAMKNRHPALGLVHEMIHAYHSATGRNMRVRKGSENLEEVITTGLPPYHYEEFSDNRFRTQLGTDTALRMKY